MSTITTAWMFLVIKPVADTVTSTVEKGGRVLVGSSVRLASGASMEKEGEKPLASVMASWMVTPFALVTTTFAFATGKVSSAVVVWIFKKPVPILLFNLLSIIVDLFICGAGLVLLTQIEKCDRVSSKG